MMMMTRLQSPPHNTGRRSLVTSARTASTFGFLQGLFMSNPFKQSPKSPFVNSNRQHMGRRGGQRPPSFSLFPFVVAGAIILAGVYWLWNVGVSGNGPLAGLFGRGAVTIFQPNAGADGYSRSQVQSLFKQALVAKKAGQTKRAIDLFLKVEPYYPGLESSISLHLADLYSQVPREDLTQIRLKKVIDRGTEGNALAAVAMYELGLSQVRAKQWEKSLETLLQLQKTFPQSNYAIGANYFLGQIYQQLSLSSQGNSLGKETQQAWITYLKQSPDGTYSLEIAKQLAKVNDILNFEQRALVANVFAKANDWAMVDTILKKGFRANSAGLVYLELLLHQGKMDSFKVNLTSWLNTVDFPVKALQPVLEQYVAKIGKAKAIPQLVALGNTSQQNKLGLAWFISQADDKLALPAYEKIATQFPKDRVAPFASSEVIRHQFITKSFGKVISQADAFLAQYPASIEAPAVLFWKAVSHQLMGQNLDATDAFEVIQSKYPYTYYAFRANAYLNNIKEASGFGLGNMAGGLPLLEKNPSNPDAWLEDYLAKSSRVPKQLSSQVRELNEIQAFDDVDLLISQTLPENSVEQVVLSAWSKVEQDQYDASLRVIRDYLSSLDVPHTVESRYHAPKTLYQLLFPLHYPAIVQVQAEREKISPYLTMALMRQESSFNPMVVSPAKAVGLMQLLPSTANDMARSLKQPPVSSLQLMDPKTNITLGSAYLQYLNNQLQQHPLLVVAAYNAGPGAVAEWVNVRQEVFAQSPDLFVETIPYDQTRHYVEHVFEGIWVYSKLYQGS
ncbi:MAG: transglycosylase SLT domain-containing protein [Vampirovibrio sp.]|nr:transglycosylase SLT domain-containing protein [Vampirovibrio sp.]